MNADRQEIAKLWWRMLSPQEKQDAFMVLLKLAYDTCNMYIRDRESAALAISEGKGDVDAIAPAWECDDDPILEVGR